MPLISPSALLYAHLTQNPPTRPTNRRPDEPRPIHLNTSSLTHANGSSLVRIGDTTVVCGVRAEILYVKDIANYRVHTSTESTTQDGEAEEEDYTPITKYNLLIPNLDLTTGASPLYPPNTPPSPAQQSLTLRLASLLHSTRLISPSALEIRYKPPPEFDFDPEQSLSSTTTNAPIPSQNVVIAYWTLYIDILPLSHSSLSTTFDAAWLALLAALSTTLLPGRATYDPDLERVVCSSEPSDATQLQVRGMPVALSWAVYMPEKRVVGLRSAEKRDGDYWSGERGQFTLIDPDGFEESCCQEMGTMVVDCGPTSGSSAEEVRGGQNEDVTVVKIEKSGGIGVNATDMEWISNYAVIRWMEWRKVLDRAKKESEGSGKG